MLAVNGVGWLRALCGFPFASKAPTVVVTGGGGVARHHKKGPALLSEAFCMVPGGGIEPPTRELSIHIKRVFGGVNLRLFFLVNQCLSFKNSVLP
jgi:hypothetical protein